MWLFTLINMPTMEAMPFTAQSQLFEKLAKVTSYANLSPEDRREYDRDLKVYRDISNQMDYARKEALEKGREEEKSDIIKRMANKGLSIDLISECVGMAADKIRHILGSIR